MDKLEDFYSKMDSSSSQCGSLGTVTDVKTQPERLKIEKKPLTRETRFNVSLLVLISLALAQLVLQLLESHIGIIAHIAIIALAAFSYEWYLVHSSSLTRHRRAFFDVSNVLETYQTRARTHGHLFVKEPDTPGVTFAAGTVDNETDGKKAQFNKARDSHYANEFERAMKAAKEMESHEGSNKSSNSPARASSSDVSVEPNMCEDEVKIKKEVEKDGNKPYAC